ncbi:MAG: hypothetical protein PUK40_07665 [Actinomycetaceae bacterium]|nr:hypothetical protein [Arcanobacterium sp.]MDD7505798.1 hypothetical protein [Actinomycetaceae bacterium]MDY6142891.1 hypothetical protein [Arcanobacterium sp.]
MKITSAQELAQALEAGERNLEIEGTITGSPSITLPEGATLSGGTLEFKAKGVRLTKNNTLRNVTITTLDYESAIYNDTSIPDAGTFVLDDVTTVGQIYIVAEGALKTVRVEANGVFVKAADVRGRVEQPHGYGVDVLQGGFTLWNRNPEPDSVFSATLRGIRVGTEETPVRGSGVFVDGYTDREGKLAGGKFVADLIETGEIVTDGGIAHGTPDKITGGVFVLGGAIVDRVENNGPVTTHGQNDMVLDLWGNTPQWVANAAITSTGASGIGFVNFGDMGELTVNAPIVTSGLGARGFNVYDGTVKSAKFHSITTHGDGAIGIQVSKPTGPIEVTGDVRTTGSEGMSLVKGVQMKLKAIGVSIKPGGEVESLTVGGVVATEADNLVSFEVLEGAKINALSIGSIEANGTESVPTKVEGEIPQDADLGATTQATLQ